MKRQFLVATVIIFLVLDVVFRFVEKQDPQFHVSALQVSNIIMAALSMAAYALVNKKTGNSPHAFVRGVYSASLLKLMVCMVAVLAYVLLNKGNIHKASVFMMFGVYAVYSITETILLSKAAKTNKEKQHP